MRSPAADLFLGKGPHQKRSGNGPRQLQEHGAVGKRGLRHHNHVDIRRFEFVDALVHARAVHDQLLRSNKLITRDLHGNVKLRGHLPRQIQVKGGTGNRHEADANVCGVHGRFSI